MIARLLISADPVIKKREIDQILASHFQSENLRTNHPDLLYFPPDSKLGIEQAKKIKEHFSLKPYSAKGMVVVLEDASALTIEAQNALLKTLEEPPQNAILILAASSDASFLPTILSRCQKIILEGEKPLIGSGEDIEKLLKLSVAARFEYIEQLKGRKEFLQALVIYFRQKMLDQPKDKELVKELLLAEEWAAQNVNIRAILEYLMLVMPTQN